jgi:hypothetical protein
MTTVSSLVKIAPGKEVNAGARVSPALSFIHYLFHKPVTQY